MKYKYQGSNSSVKVAGIMFAAGVETELTDEQTKALKADKFGKTFLDDGTLVEVKADTNIVPDAKPVDKMTVKELEQYITDNGGEFGDDDNKPELLQIAQGIEGNQPK